MLFTLIQINQTKQIQEHDSQQNEQIEFNSSISSTFFEEKSLSDDLLVAVHEQDLMKEVSDADIPSSFLSSESSSDSEYDPTLINKANPAGDDEIQGYDSNGRPIFVIQEQPGDKVKRMIALQKNSENLFTEIYDEKEGRYIKINREDYQKFYDMVHKGKTFSGLNPEEKPELKFIDQTFDFPAVDSIVPPKSVFTNKREYKLKAHIAKLIKEGKLDKDDLDGYKKLKKQYDEKEEAFNTLFSGEQRDNIQQLYGVNKLPLPMTKDSYNPGYEYLKDEDEDKNISLRTIQPQTEELAKEIFQHQNDLYFKPKTFKPEETYENSIAYLQKQLDIESVEELKPYPSHLVQKIRCETKLNCVDISHNNKFIATGGADCLLRIYEKFTGKLLQTIQLLSVQQQKQMQAEHISTEITDVRFLNIPDALLIVCVVGNQIVFVNPMFNPVQYANDNVKLLKGWHASTMQGRVDGDATDPQQKPDENDDENMNQFTSLTYQLNHKNKSDTAIMFTELNSYIQLRIYSPIPLYKLDITKNSKYILVSSIYSSKQSLTCFKIHDTALIQLNLLGQKACSPASAVWINDTGSLLVSNHLKAQEFDVKRDFHSTQNFTLQPNCGEIQKIAVNNKNNDIVVIGNNGKISYFIGVQQQPTDFNNFFKISCRAADFKENMIVVGGYDGVMLVLKIVKGKMRVCTSFVAHKVLNQQGVFDVKIFGNTVTSVGADGCLCLWE